MRVIEPKPEPVALACGMLEDGGRIFFLVRRNAQGAEAIELPCILVFKGENPVAALSVAFRQQTGIDAQVHETIMERRHNAGSRRKKKWIPALVFKITAKNRTAKQSSEFSGYKWLSFKDASAKKLSRNCEWLRSYP